MDEYVKVNVKDYVNAGISNGTMVPREAYKFTRIIARPGVPNETIISWSISTVSPTTHRCLTSTNRRKLPSSFNFGTNIAKQFVKKIIVSHTKART